MENKKPYVQLRACRVNSGLSQTEWAESLGVGEKTIYNWENYKTPIPANKLIKVAELSGFAVDDIILCP